MVGAREVAFVPALIARETDLSLPNGAIARDAMQRTAA
jgi:hypothetical protein